MHIGIPILTLVSNLMSDLQIDPKDRQYVLRRINNEGVTFLTVTLPKLVKCVLQGIECGSFIRAIKDTSFTHIAWKSGSLRYFRSLLLRIFDSDGVPLSGHDAAAALRTLRQLGEYLYKLTLEFTAEQLHIAEEKYLEKESDLQIASKKLDTGWAESLRRNFETYYSELSTVTLAHILTNHRPRFTKGAFAGSSKFDDPTLFKVKGSPATLELFRGISGYLKSFPSSRERVRLLETDTASHVEASFKYRGKKLVITTRRVLHDEVLFVPKDSRGPRVISKVPFHTLMVQMAFFDFVSTKLEKVTNGRVNFRDQEVNQRLAKIASITKNLVTADLKDASDSVLARLIRVIFRHSPGLRWFIRTCRVPSAKLPSGKIVRLEKLSGMGSGLTFATMALLIHLSVCTMVAQRTRLPYQQVARRVYVYGDDLIVPKEWWVFAQEALVASCLQVNTSKSYANSHFRESCGADYYDGVNVTPVRLKISSGVEYRNKALRIDEARGVVQLERHCRELVKAGMFFTSQVIYKSLEKGLGKLPYVYGESPVLGRYDRQGPFLDTKGYIIVPNTRFSARVDPTKYLGRCLAKENAVLDLLNPEPATRYGELVSPYDVKILRRRVSSASLRGITPHFS